MLSWKYRLSCFVGNGESLTLSWEQALSCLVGKGGPFLNWGPRVMGFLIWTYREMIFSEGTQGL